MDYYGAKSLGEQVVAQIKQSTSDPAKLREYLAAAEDPIRRAADEAYNHWRREARIRYNEYRRNDPTLPEP